MAKNFWNIVNRVIREADVLLLILDARMIDETRNSEVESKVKALNKPLIYCITKSDLVDKKSLEKINLKPSVFVSAKKYFGTTLLRERILIEGKRAYKDKNIFCIGVLGYPNVGKSSLINAMKGRRSAPTSPLSGFTRGVQKIKADNRLIFLDTPGVIPNMEKDTSKHTLIGAIDFDKVQNPDEIISDLMKKFPSRIELFYEIKTCSDAEEAIELIAKKKNLLKKGAEPDIERAARMILKDWQTGKLT